MEILPPQELIEALGVFQILSYSMQQNVRPKFCNFTSVLSHKRGPNYYTVSLLFRRFLQKMEYKNWCKKTVTWKWQTGFTNLFVPICIFIIWQMLFLSIVNGKIQLWYFQISHVVALNV